MCEFVLRSQSPCSCGFNLGGKFRQHSLGMVIYKLYIHIFCRGSTFNFTSEGIYGSPEKMSVLNHPWRFFCFYKVNAHCAMHKDKLSSFLSISSHFQSFGMGERERGQGSFEGSIDATTSCCCCCPYAYLLACLAS